MPEVTNGSFFLPALSIVLHKPTLFKINCEHCTWAQEGKKNQPGQQWMPVYVCVLDFCVCVCANSVSG